MKMAMHKNNPGKTRRRLVGSSILAVALLSAMGVVQAQTAAQPAATQAVSYSAPSPFGPLKHVKAGLLDVAYAETGPANGPVVILLHGWPYDIHSYDDVAPILAAKGYRVLMPYARGYGDTQFLSAKTVRNGHYQLKAKLGARSDIENVQVDPWSAGNYGLPDEEGRRLSHTFCWYRSEKNDNGYAHPIEGLCAVVDLDRAEVLRVDDYGVADVPRLDRNYAARYRSVFRDDVKPLEIVQPAGPSFVVEGNEVVVTRDDGIRAGIKEYSNWPTIPQLYVKGEFIGGSDIMMEMYESGELKQVLGTEG